MRDIKTREHHQFIKTKNKKENMKHFVKKNQVLKKKRNDIHKQNNEDYENEATNRVVDYEKKTAYDIQHYSKRIMQKRKIKRTGTEITMAALIMPPQSMINCPLNSLIAIAKVLYLLELTKLNA